MNGALTVGLACIVTVFPNVDRAPRTLSSGPCAAPYAGDPADGSGTGADERCRAEIDVMVGDMLDWIADHTDYDVAAMRDRAPAVSFVETGERIDCEGEELVVEEGLHAVYDHSTRRIRLVLPWNAGDTFDRSALLHEIVHDVQLGSRHWYCPEETEWEAYKLQHTWLAEQGVESGFDWLHVYFLSRCPRDMHP